MDVLKVIDDACVALYEERAKVDARQLSQARSAIAELIEAADAVDVQVGRCVGIDAESLANLRKALSAVRPSQGDGGGKGEGEKVG